MKLTLSILALLFIALPAFSSEPERETFHMNVQLIPEIEANYVSITVTSATTGESASTKLATTVVNRKGNFFPAIVSGKIENARIKGTHVEVFDVDVVKDDEVIGTQQITAIVEFDSNGHVIFFSGVGKQPDAGNVTQVYLWGTPSSLRILGQL